MRVSEVEISRGQWIVSWKREKGTGSMSKSAEDELPLLLYLSFVLQIWTTSLPPNRAFPESFTSVQSDNLVR